MTAELAQRVVLVTGAAHRLGRAIALRLGEEGCRVVVHFHRAQAAAARTVSEIRASGGEAVSIGADLATMTGVRHLFEAIDGSVGSLGLFVNSAAILEPIDLLEAEEEDWDRTMNLNLKGAFFCLQQAAKRMQATGGAIVNISDVAALRPWKRYPIHSISKAGIEMLTRTAALALAPKIRVNAVAPGLALKPESMPDERWQALAAGTPLGRPGNPPDIGDAVVFLFQNDYITGETLIVDGGYHLV